MTTQDQRFADAQSMSTDELRAAVRRLGVTPKGGLSRASRRDLINWYVINTPRPDRSPEMTTLHPIVVGTPTDAGLPLDVGALVTYHGRRMAERWSVFYVARIDADDAFGED